MPEVDGFEVLRRARPAEVPAVVFVTAHDAYAIRAFEAEALDYLLKPFDDERFHRTVERAKARVREHLVNRLARRMAATLDARAEPAPAASYVERLPIRREGKVFFVRVDDVDWIEAADYCVRIHTAGRFHLLRETLGEMESRLDPHRFFRVHRSAIVNLGRIKELQSHFHGDGVVVLHDGSRLRVSRGRRERLHQLLGLTG
jgi:two-component system LytT family response regulator